MSSLKSLIDVRRPRLLKASQKLLSNFQAAEQTGLLRRPGARLRRRVPVLPQVRHRSPESISEADHAQG